MSFVEGLVLIIFILALSGTINLIIKSRYSTQGRILVDTKDGKVNYILEVDIDPYDIQYMKNVSFKVVKNDSVN